MESGSFFNIVIDLVTLLISTPGNIFILMVIILDFADSRKLHISYQLICGITICNICGQLMHICEDILVLLDNHLFCVTTASKLLITFDMVNYLCISNFSTWLCLHFCLKIVTINQKFYIYLQRLFPKIFNWILISTIVGSFALGFISVWNKSDGSTFNNTLSEYTPTVAMYDKNVVFADVSVIPILLSFIILSFSAVTVIISLFKHMKHLKNNAKGFRPPSVEAHVKATQTIVSLLIINFVHLGAGLFYFFLSIFYIYKYVSGTCVAITYVFTPIILIKGNRKLEKTFYKLFKACHG